MFHSVIHKDQRQLKCLCILRCIFQGVVWRRKQMAIWLEGFFYLFIIADYFQFKIRKSTIFVFFFNCCFAALRSALGHLWRQPQPILTTIILILTQVSYCNTLVDTSKVLYLCTNSELCEAYFSLMFYVSYFHCFRASHVSKIWRAVIRYCDIDSGKRVRKFLRTLKNKFVSEKVYLFFFVLGIYQ